MKKIILPDSGSRPQRRGTALPADLQLGSGAFFSADQQPGLVLPLGGTQRLSEPSWIAVLPSFEAETAYINAFDAREWAMKAKIKHRLPPYRQSLMRDDADHLLDRTNFVAIQPQMASILKDWLKRRKTSAQLNVHGFAEKVAIAASSIWSRRMAYLRCCPFCHRRRNLYPCDETHLCPIFHNIGVGDPLQQKFGGSFGEASYWYALSFCYVFRAKKAKLRLVTKMNGKGEILDSEILPLFESSPDVRRLNQFDASELEACGRVPFKALERLTKNLKRRWGLCGAVAGLDLFVEFFPVGSASGECSVGHGFQVHVHALLNTPRPLSWKDSQRIYASFCKLRQEAGISLYPDLDIRPILTPERYLGWLRYTIKPMKFEEFYAQGSFACADRPEAFNDEFDQTVFEGAHAVYGNVKSPRYYGNIQQRRNAKHEFIGVWQYPPALNKTDFKGIKERIERNLPMIGEEEEKYDDHCLYLQQQDEQRRARKARKQERRKRRGGRGASSGGAATSEASSGVQDAAARFREREGQS